MGTAGIGTVGLIEAIDAFFPLIPIFLSLGTSHELVIGGMGLFEMPGGSGFLGGRCRFSQSGQLGSGFRCVAAFGKSLNHPPKRVSGFLPVSRHVGALVQLQI
jgi:hypothetical protein